MLGIVFDSMAWIYSLAWSVSFYGQIFQNRRLRSVEGMNLDYLALNVHGFTLYFIYNIWGYYIDQQQTGLVQEADLLFATHALLATLYTAWQALIYKRGNNKIRRITLVYIGAQWVFLAGFWGLNGKGVIAIMGYFKLGVSCIKYIPQLYWNFQRQSTVGWSIFNVSMDLTGGLFSFAETLLRLGTDPAYELNRTKMFLGLLSIAYDLLFMFQHYCLYRQRDEVIASSDSESNNTQMESPVTNQARVI